MAPIDPARPFAPPRALLAALSLLLILPGAQAKVIGLPSGYRTLFQDSPRFQEIQHVIDLPVAIIALCADAHDTLAEPGRSYQATDVVKTPHLPRKRLIWAATDGQHYVVHYEMGGYGHSYHVLVATVNTGDSKPTDVWYGTSGRLKDFPAFVDALRKGSLDDTRNDYH
jgi:hypothetical protein